MTLTSISLPVHIHQDATHVIYDADGNQVAVCGPAFSELDGTGKLLQQSEAIAEELVRVLNAYDEMVAHLEVLADPQNYDDGPGVIHVEVVTIAERALALARGEPVS